MGKSRLFVTRKARCRWSLHCISKVFRMETAARRPPKPIFALHRSVRRVSHGALLRKRLGAHMLATKDLQNGLEGGGFEVPRPEKSAKTTPMPTKLAVFGFHMPFLPAPSPRPSKTIMIR